jgi:multiple sugar transport system ATP-binding protein
MAAIEFRDVTKVYPGGTKAVDSLDLEVGDGEFMVLVGPSGCGKTTALRMVAGLEEVSDGTIRIGERVVNEVSPRDRDIAMVFQSYALYPHMTVRENLAFGLRLRKLAKPDVEQRVRAAASTLELADFLDRKPRALSGGQRQRVAMGRAIVREPQAFLMDEPLSNLDAKLRVQMRAEIHKLQRALGVTTVYVTHDQVEAMTMGDRVAVMSGGQLQQVDAPERLYERPANQFVAGFIGSPSMNMVEARLSRATGPIVRFGNHELPVVPALLAERPGLARYEGREVILGIRPEDMEDAAFAPTRAESPHLKVICSLREALGSEVLLHFSVGSAEAPPAEDDDVIEPLGDQGSIFVARVNPRTAAREAQQVDLAVHPTRLHFFDLESTDAIVA